MQFNTVSRVFIAGAFVLVVACSRPARRALGIDKAPEDAISQFAARVDKEIADLRERYGTWPDLDTRDGSDSIFHCKRVIRDLVAECDPPNGKANRQKGELLADRLVALLEASDQVKFHDMYVIWRGGRLLLEYPQVWGRLLGILSKKISTRATLPPELSEISAFPLASFSAYLVSYEDELAIDEEHIDWRKWPACDAWIDEARTSAAALAASGLTYGNEVRRQLDSLTSGRDPFPGDTRDGADGATNPAARAYYVGMSALMLSATSADRCRVLSEELWRFLVRSEKLEWYEFYPIVRAAPLLYHYPPRDIAPIVTVATKLTTRAQSTCNHDMQALMQQGAAELISRVVKHDNTFGDKAGIDWDAWAAFYEWLRQHQTELVFDPEAEAFRIR